MLLGLNGLRVSEACDTDIGDLGFRRGHRTLRIVGKGHKPAVIPLVPRTARTVDLAIGERREGPILVRHDGQRLDRRTAHRWVKAIGKRAGLGHVHPHMLSAETLNPAQSSCTPVFALMGLLVPGEKLRDLNWEFLQLKKQFNPSLANVRLSELIQTEVKGSDLRADLRSGKRDRERRTIGLLDKTL